MTAITRRRVQTTKITTTWNGSSPVTADCFANSGLSQHQVVVWCSGLPRTGLVEVSVRPMGAGFYVPVGTIDLTVNGTGTFMFCALIDGIQLSFPGGVSSGIIIGATIYSVGLYFTVGDDYLQDDARRRVVADMITNPNPWNGSGSVTATMTNHAGLTQHQLAITGGTGLVELQGRPQGGSAFVSIDVQCQQITASGMLVIFAGLWDAFRLVPQGTVTGSIQAQIASVGELLFFNNVAQGTYGSATTVPVITVNGGGQIVDITSVPINISGALGYAPIATFNGRAGTGNPPNITLAGTDVVTALGYTPANASNVVISFNTRQGAVTLSSGDVTAALGYTPNNPSSFMYGLRNLLINASGIVNQRVYVSGTATTGANQYTVDRWRVQTSGQNLSWTTSGNISTFTAPAGGVAQVIEGVNILGGTYCISWTGNATCTVNGTAQTNGSFFTLPAATNATVVFSSGTVTEPQVEFGSVRTSFEYRPLAIELVLCQRYYEKSYELSTAPGSISVPGFEQCLLSGLPSATYTYAPSVSFKVTKRSAPTFTPYGYSSGTSGRCLFNGSDVIPASIGTSSRNAVINIVAPAASTSFNITYQWTANAEL